MRMPCSSLRRTICFSDENLWPTQPLESLRASRGQVVALYKGILPIYQSLAGAGRNVTSTRLLPVLRGDPSSHPWKLGNNLNRPPPPHEDVYHGRYTPRIKAALILSVLSHCHTVTRVKRNRPSKKKEKEIEPITALAFLKGSFPQFPRVDIVDVKRAGDDLTQGWF